MPPLISHWPFSQTHDASATDLQLMDFRQSSATLHFCLFLSGNFVDNCLGSCVPEMFKFGYIIYFTHLWFCVFVKYAGKFSYNLYVDY